MSYSEQQPGDGGQQNASANNASGDPQPSLQHSLAVPWEAAPTPQNILSDEEVIHIDPRLLTGIQLVHRHRALQRLASGEAGAREAVPNPVNHQYHPPAASQDTPVFSSQDIRSSFPGNFPLRRETAAPVSDSPGYHVAYGTAPSAQIVASQHGRRVQPPTQQQYTYTNNNAYANNVISDYGVAAHPNPATAHLFAPSPAAAPTMGASAPVYNLAPAPFLEHGELTHNMAPSAPNPGFAPLPSHVGTSADPTTLGGPAPVSGHSSTSPFPAAIGSNLTAPPAPNPTFAPLPSRVGAYADPTTLGGPAPISLHQPTSPFPAIGSNPMAQPLPSLVGRSADPTTLGGPAPVSFHPSTSASPTIGNNFNVISAPPPPPGPAFTPVAGFPALDTSRPTPRQPLEQEQQADRSAGSPKRKKQKRNDKPRRRVICGYCRKEYRADDLIRHMSAAHRD